MDEIILTILQYMLVIGIGLGCGSYATMPYYRLPNGEACAGKWIGKKSHCTQCNHQLRTRDLVPVFNWLLTRGKCQFCGYKINPVYFFIELSVTILSVLIFTRFGMKDLHLYMMVLGLATCMVILTAIEYSFRKGADQVLVVVVVFAFLYSSPDQFNDMIITFTTASVIGLAYAHSYENIYKVKTPRFDYVKLFAISGFWLPYHQLFVHLGLVVVLCGIIFVLHKIKNSEKSVPYGYALTVSLMVNVLYPNWYNLLF